MQVHAHLRDHGAHGRAGACRGGARRAGAFIRLVCLPIYHIWLNGLFPELCRPSRAQCPDFRVQQSMQPAPETASRFRASRWSRRACTLCSSPPWTTCASPRRTPASVVRLGQPPRRRRHTRAYVPAACACNVLSVSVLYPDIAAEQENYLMQHFGCARCSGTSAVMTSLSFGNAKKTVACLAAPPLPWASQGRESCLLANV